ncbi:MAG TPA: GyrI-like domain-containing protein [Acidobacteriaceae bacterium]
MIDEPKVLELEARQYAYTRRTVPLGQIGVVMGPAIAVVVAALKEQKLTPSGPWFTHHLRRPTDFFDFEVCFPVTCPMEAVGEGESRVAAGVWPAMRVAQTTYRGGYAQLAHAWGELEGWMRAQGLAGGTEFWEVYAVGPHTEAEAEKWETELNWPLAE